MRIRNSKIRNRSGDIMKKSSIRIRVSQSGGMMMRENSGTNLRFSLRGTRKGTKESIIEMVDQTKILKNGMNCS